MFDKKSWRLVDNNAPGYFGKKRDEKFEEYDQIYGKGNWQVAWYLPLQEFQLLEFEEACKLYEDAYFHYLSFRPDLVDLLCQTASDVYDDEIKNIDSGLNYLIQKGPVTHIQDIAVRNCIRRLDRNFEGKELVQVRSKEGKHWFGALLSPCKVPFHRLDLVAIPDNICDFEGAWWGRENKQALRYSTEGWYQLSKRIIKKIF